MRTVIYILRYVTSTLLIYVNDLTCVCDLQHFITVRWRSWTDDFNCFLAADFLEFGTIWAVSLLVQVSYAIVNLFTIKLHFD